MDKAHIIAEIQRTAAANGGKALGKLRFENETGITETDWGRYWARFGDAIAEAGHTPNSKSEAYDQNWMIEQLMLVIRELGRYPVSRELKIRALGSQSFPSPNALRRLGGKREIASKVISYCEQRSDYDDVVAICQPIVDVPAAPETADIDDSTDDPTSGYVYLFKSGKHYKIGRSNSAGRREYEIAIQLPEPLTTVHTISTDDPVGIEDYWHRRFAAKRLNGEWFNLDAADIRAFKRRKFM